MESLPESFRTILFAFSALLLWALVLMQVDAQSRLEEVAALTSFKNQVEAYDGPDTSSYAYNSYGPYWFTWKEEDKNACAWSGVTCTANYTAEALDFSGWELDFPLGDVSLLPLSYLSDLRELDLSSNSIGGFIPDDIGSLTRLSRLDLSNNQLSGSIPASISACRGLQFLSLEKNLLNGTLPNLTDLEHLQFLLLADNRLSGAFPSALGEMSSLLSVDISRNQLSGRIPSLLDSTNLASLLLDNNSFTGFEEPMRINAPTLRKLSVGANLLQGTIPLALRDLPDLVILNMSFNRLSSTIPFGLYHGTGQFFVLDFSHNQLSGSIPGDLLQRPSNISDSKYVSLSYNLLNGSIPTTTTSNESQNGSGTLDLDLSHNNLRGPVPVSLVISADYLTLDNNFLSGDIVDVLNTAIHSLNSTGNLSLVLLSLSNNYFTGDLAGIEFPWTSLQFIDLSNNNLSCRASESISDPGSALLYNLAGPETRFISLRGNNFSGTSLPTEPVFKGHEYGFPLLESLDLSNCQLGGNISAALFNIMEMPNLLALDLSHNLLTGPVLENLTNIAHLELLDVSYNNLAGPLPPITRNLLLGNASFFVGNEGLCGYPLDPCPQVYPSTGTGVQWWTLLIIIVGSLVISGGSCLMVTWRWRVYRKLHEQDADLIQTLMERELVTLMPLRNLKKATNNFDKAAQIGEGGFGTVYIGKLEGGTEVAIKRSKREGSEKDKQQFLNEVRILSQVNHRHLVKLLGCCMENQVALLVFEFISNGNLQEHLCGKVGDGHLSWKQRLSIATQTADALNYLHSSTTHPIFHRDVKSANILLDNELRAKVADFGISKLAPTGATHVSTALQGTIGYMDPEYWVSFQLTDKSDVYSFGVILLELISAKSPIDFRRGEEETSLAVFASPYIHSESLDPLIDPTLMAIYSERNGHGKKSILDLGRLAMRCLELQSTIRPSMNEVWKELQDLCREFGRTFVEEDLGPLSNDQSGNSIVDLSHEVGLSPPNFVNRLDSLKQTDARSLELT